MEMLMQTEILKVTGMTCGGCVSNVTRALVAIDGVHDVKVTLLAANVASEVNVQYDEQFTSPDYLKLAVSEAGFGIEAGN
jgi:copper chaperone